MSAPKPNFPTLLQDFFQRRLVAERGVSAHTITSYRDSFGLLLRYAEQRTGRMASALTLQDLDAPMILSFLDHLETERHCSARTRNLRLTAIRSFMRYVSVRDPASLPVAQRVLAIAGKPLLAFSVQGGDTQDQNLLQFFLNMVEFGMDVQQAVEAHNFTSFQMQSSFGAHDAEPGRIEVTRNVPPFTREQLQRMGYRVETVERTYSPITAIWFDRLHGVMQGGASDYGDDYGIAW